MKRRFPLRMRWVVVLFALVFALVTTVAALARLWPQLTPARLACSVSSLSAIGSTRYQALFGDPKRALEESQKAVYFARCTPDRRAYLLALSLIHI